MNVRLTSIAAGLAIVGVTAAAVLAGPPATRPTTAPAAGQPRTIAGLIAQFKAHQERVREQRHALDDLQRIGQQMVLYTNQASPFFSAAAKRSAAPPAGEKSATRPAG